MTADAPSDGGAAYRRPMIRRLSRFVIFRVIGGRLALALMALGFIRGRRRRRRVDESR